VWWNRVSTPTITDAQPSADDQLRHRRRVYTVIMAIHIIGFAVGGSLYARAWWTGLIIIIVTGPLQWIAVLLANAAPRRPAPQTHPNTPSGIRSAGRLGEVARVGDGELGDGERPHGLQHVLPAVIQRAVPDGGD
jgi:hypothetical protein